MTTEAAANLYLTQHLFDVQGRKRAVYNPHSKPVGELPVIYGFNNGGSSGWLQAVAMAQDGEVLGSHVCSHEGYMPHDIGMLEGNTYRAEAFTKHYPDGWRTEFVDHAGIPAHKGLNEAFRLNTLQGEAAHAQQAADGLDEQP